MTWKKKYMRQFTVNFDQLVNKFLIPVSIFSYLLAVREYDKQGASTLFFMNIAIGTMFLVLSLLGKRMKTEHKLEIIIIMVLITGIKVMVSSGFQSNGISLLMIACIVSIVFLSNIFSSVVVILSTAFLFIISLLVGCSIFKSSFSTSIWIIQSLTFMILMLVSYFSVKLLKKHLLASIEKLEQNTLDMQGMVVELESKYDEIKQNEEMINKLAYYDQLTGLPNHHMLKKHIEKRIAENVAEGKLVIIDVKNFKIFNSIYSNMVGDEILALLGELISTIVDDSRFAARITGNEYVIWFENADEKHILDTILGLKDGFYKRYSELIKYKKIDFYISYSIYPEHAADYNGLYQKAAIALANAREFPDRKITAYNDTLHEKMLKDEYLKQLVERAIHKNEFILYYQTKVDVGTGNVCGVEALSRWKSKELGFVTPNVFIPVIEKSNLTVKFGENVIRNVLNDYGILIDKFGVDLKISINVSPVHVISEGFVEFVINEITKRNINPENIILEITEEVMIEGVDSINGILQPLKDFGVKISLDDFGSGYSSLNNLARLGPDELKIDKTFMEQIDDKKVVSLLESIIQLQNVYGYSVVVEGVETKEQMEIVKNMGCNIIQGFYFSKPTELH